MLFTDDGRKVYLHSRYDPRRESRRWAESLNLSPNSLLVLFGLGLGYPVEAVLEQSHSDFPVIVFEPNSDVVRLARRHRMSANLLENPRVQVVGNWEEFCAVRRRSAPLQQNMQLLTVPSYGNAYPELLQAFCDNIKNELLRIQSHYVTSIASARQWQENFFHNIRYFADSAPVGRAFGFLERSPLIIVSAGPSLCKNVDLLKQAKGKALIVAVGSVVKLLRDREILPDLVISTDGGAGNYDRFSGVDWPMVPLLYSPIIYSKILQEYRGPKVLAATAQAEWIARFLGPEVLGIASGPSVAHLAFSLALRLAADPIIFVGQDLAYRDGHSHAPTLENTHVNADVRVRAIDGGEVLTSKVLRVFLSWFEEAIREVTAENPSQKFINATEGGAHISGTEVLSLRETLQRYCHADISSKIHSIIAAYSRPPDYSLQEFLKYLKTARHKLKRLRPQLQKACAVADRLARSDSAESMNREALERLEKADRKLKRESRYLQVFDYLIHPVADISVHLSGSLSAIQESVRFYRSLEQALDCGIPMLARSIQALEQVLQKRQDRREPDHFHAKDPSVPPTKAHPIR